MLAQRILTVERSPFYSIMDLAAKRSDCLYLHLGEPDFDTPSHIVQAGQKALAGGKTHYTPDRGVPELRRLLAQKIQNESHAGYSFEDEILITAGGQAALHTAIMGTVNPGDEVVLLSPYYPPYLANVQLAGGTPIVVPMRSEDDFTPNPEIIERYITEKTKALILHSPNNPTGSVYGKEALSRLVDLAERRNFFIISDEVYEKYIYGGKIHWSLVSFPNAKERTILVNSFSKTYAMTGWRVGYIAAYRETLLQLLKYHHTVNICANAAAQEACIAALEGPQDCIQEMVKEYDRRREFLVKELNCGPGIRCVPPQGAFYVFADIRELRMPSLEFVKYLVQEAGVVMANGSGFGMEGFIRLSYSTKIEHLDEAIHRIQKAVDRLRMARP
ncbi:MAG: pyridoxal phosphate-dependent aminotransferase [Candidatus Binatia bacterium]